MNKYLLSLVCFFLFSFNNTWADEYYCILFSSDSAYPKYVHVWGTFVQMKDKQLVKEVTISWAPVGNWNILDRKKPGYNMSLIESMEMYKKYPFSVYGPYLIDEEFFKRAELSYNTPGNYKMIDTLSRDAYNCIHRLALTSGKKLITHVRYGKFALYSIYNHFLKEGLIFATDDKDTVIAVLNLNKYNLKMK